MEQQEMQEERRARNFVWAAAGHYGLEPLFLAYAPDGTADMYLNMIIGLSYKWYDAEKLETFFYMLGGRQEELYQGMLWIGLEQALYEKEKIHRPVLAELRQEYAQENLARYRVLKEYELIDQLRNGHCAEILGKSSGLSGRTEELLRELTFTGEMGIEQILAKMKEILWKYFSYEPKMIKKERGTYFLQKLLPAFHSIGKMHATYVKTKRYDDLSWEESGNGGTMEKARHYLLQFSRQGDEEKDRAYIEGCFGANIYTPMEQKLLEDEVCTENHKNSHLYITRGYPMEEPVTQTGSNTTVRHQEESTEREATDRGETASHTVEDIGQVFGSGAINKRESREIREFRENSKRQAEKNRQHYEKNRTVYENSIRRMTEKLRLELDARMDDVPVQARQGNIRASQVWRALYLEDPRVFEKREEVSDAGFSVDILDSYKISAEDSVGGLESAFGSHEDTNDLNVSPFQLLHLFGGVFHSDLVCVFPVFVKCALCGDLVILRAAVCEYQKQFLFLFTLCHQMSRPAKCQSVAVISRCHIGKYFFCFSVFPIGLKQPQNGITSNTAIGIHL